MVPRAHNAMLQGFQPRIALSVPAPLFSLILVHPLPLADAPRFRCRSLFTGRLRVLVLIANHLFPYVPGLVHVFVLVSVNIILMIRKLIELRELRKREQEQGHVGFVFEIQFDALTGVFVNEIPTVGCIIV